MGDFETELQQWACLQPKAGHTGCAIVVAEEETHPYLVEIGYSEKSYVVQTDFGNVFKMTEEEVKEVYSVVRIESDPLDRFLRQKELLEKVFEVYYGKGEL